MRPTSRPTNPDGSPRTYTRQEILQRIWDHFIKDKQPRCVVASLTGEFCSYKKTGCAVGCLLTQEDANHLQDGLTISSLISNQNSIICAYFNLEYKGMLSDLQRAHDKELKNQNDGGARWLAELAYTIGALAYKYGCPVKLN